MESPLADIETNRNIEQETPRIAAADKDRDQVVRNALMSGHPGGVTPGNPRAFAPRHLQIPLTQGQYSSTKSYHCPPPWGA